MTKKNLELNEMFFENDEYQITATVTAIIKAKNQTKSPG